MRLLWKVPRAPKETHSNWSTRWLWTQMFRQKLVITVETSPSPRLIMCSAGPISRCQVSFTNASWVSFALDRLKMNWRDDEKQFTSNQVWLVCRVLTVDISNSIPPLWRSRKHLMNWDYSMRTCLFWNYQPNFSFLTYICKKIKLGFPVLLMSKKAV